MQKTKTSTLKKLFALALDLGGIIIMLGGISLDMLQNNTSHLGIGAAQIAAILFGLGMTVASSLIRQPQSIWIAMWSTKLPSSMFFFISVVLLGINTIGCLIPLRNPDVYQNWPHGGKDRSVALTREQVYAQMNRNAKIDEQYPKYTKRLTQLIYDGTIHYWGDQIEDNAFNHKIPIYENYIIYALSQLRADEQLYEFCKAERAIDRAVSVCSQSSRILANLLIRNRVRANIVGLDGHVVVRARVDKDTDQWWILDADYGVVIEHDIDEVAINLELVRKAYQKQGYDEETIETVANIYAPEGNQILDTKLDCSLEKHYYLTKWYLPIIGLLPFVLFLSVYMVRKRQFTTYEG
ncbi:MAG: hypothetical protein U9Q82_09390 [Chloroflexota bacterium]|nr:hypothetical protein [Chloroflexota bacterium]